MAFITRTISVTVAPTPLQVGAYYPAKSIYPELAAKGVNFVHELAGYGGTRLPHLNDAQAAGLGFWLEFRWGHDAFTLANLTSMLAPYSGHPALRALMLVDEPDSRGTPPAEIRAAYQHLKSLSPLPVVNVIQFNWEAGWHVPPQIPGLSYTLCQDVALSDWYPVDNGQLVDMAPFVDLAEQLVAPGKAGAAIQTFHKPNGGTRVPTPAEVQTMGLLAIQRGARFLMCYKAPDWDGPIRSQLASIISAWRAAA